MTRICRIKILKCSIHNKYSDILYSNGTNPVRIVTFIEIFYSIISGEIRGEIRCEIIIEYFYLARISLGNLDEKCISRRNGDEISDSRSHGSGTSRRPMNSAWNEMWKTYRIKVPCNFTRTEEFSAKWNVKWPLNETVLLEQGLIYGSADDIEDRIVRESNEIRQLTSVHSIAIIFFVLFSYYRVIDANRHKLHFELTQLTNTHRIDIL